MPHIRKDSVTKRWVIMSASRGAKPSDYVNKKSSSVESALSCPFCKGHEDKTPTSLKTVFDKDGLWRVRVVPNKYPAISDVPDPDMPEHSLLFEANMAIGYHDVIIEHPEHDFDFYQASTSDLVFIFEAAMGRLSDLSNTAGHYSLYFKNYGAEAGASLAHSHSQIITTPFIPVQMIEEMHGALDYYLTHKGCVYCAIIREELHLQKRVICENKNFIAIAPFASRFPYQIWILPKEHADSVLYSEVTGVEFCSMVSDVFSRLKNVLGSVSFNYVLHSLPSHLRASYASANHWYLEIIPKMSKLAGYELGSGVYFNSMLPEDAAIAMRGY